MCPLDKYYTHPDTGAEEIMKDSTERCDKNTQTNEYNKGWLRSRILTLETQIKEIYADQYWQFAGDECMKVRLEKELGILRGYRRDLYNCDRRFNGDDLYARGSTCPMI